MQHDIIGTIDSKSPEHLGEEVVEGDPLLEQLWIKAESSVRVDDGYLTVRRTQTVENRSRADWRRESEGELGMLSRHETEFCKVLHKVVPGTNGGEDFGGRSRTHVRRGENISRLSVVEHVHGGLKDARLSGTANSK